MWENARWHRSKALREQLRPGKPLEAVHLINLPPYCPDHNPIEHVWREAKDAVSNAQLASFNRTRAAFEEFIRNSTSPTGCCQRNQDGRDNYLEGEKEGSC